MKKDFEVLIKIMNGFVNQRSIQNKLNIIEECSITGWETWFQIEFASYLGTHEDVSEWRREESYYMDKRKSKNKSRMAVDFLIRQKHTKKDQYIAIELKQHLSASTCINNMLKDIDKVCAARESYTDFRSFWCIGIHQKETKKLLKETIIKKAQEKHITMYKHMDIRYIPNTNFAYTIF